ncbi:hypothetical protein [Pseudocnuella soli]|uniref:hypothetical protein n=1 Tax=Pseudocnuella soli TaxID=2502779 RepID=UPI00104F281E|nr:hypothetical protein [Pseudocnuella soli]
MNLKRKTIKLVHHSWLWIKERKALPVFISLLLLAELSIYHADASNNQTAGQFQGSKVTLNDSSVPFFNIDPIDPVSEDSNDSDEPDDQNTEQGLDETEDGPDDFWKTCHRAFLALSDYSEESKPSVVTHSVQHLETLPLFILHCSWKSFLF